MQAVSNRGNCGVGRGFWELYFLVSFSINLNCSHNRGMAGHWWLTPIILAIQKAEIRRIAVQSQPRQIVPETLSQKNPSQKGLVKWLKV
jgi:hypothetical protein